VVDRVLNVALDGTPLLGRRTGVGRYTEHLMSALVKRDDVRVSVLAITLRGSGELRSAVPPGVRTRSVRFSARAMHVAWARWQFPPISLLTRGLDVYHGTNFVLPPIGRLGGVVMIHDIAYLTMPDVVDEASRRLRTLVPDALRRAAVVVTPSQTTADRVREAYPGITPQIVPTPLGVQPTWLEATPPTGGDRRRLDLPDDYFLFVGTREPRKDLPTLVAAYRALRESAGPDVPALLLVGPPGWGPELVGAPGVRVLDYAPAGDLETIVAGARALVMPSRDEGFGLPALEALAAGTRVIVSDIPALREVTGDQASTVFPVGDVDALSAALAQMLATDDGDDGRARRRAYAAQWTWDRCADRTVEAYRIAAG
jgi:glycosyltransferase involved in cell wall biosynthesis